MGARALILAAGRGTRLGGSAHEVPKCLLEIGRRRLIEHQIEALADAGVGPVHIVVGYAADEIREIVGMRAEYVVNTRWEQTNSLYSFALARDVIQGQMFLLNSDVLFAPEILERLLDQPGDAVAIDSGSGSGREQMKVEAVNGRVLGMSKDLAKERVAGENVGIVKLTEATTRAAFEHATALLERGGENSWVGEAITEVARERELRAVDVAGLPWIEIDFASDLQRARREIWPKIEDGKYRRRRLSRLAAWTLGALLLVGALYIGAKVPPPGVAPPMEWDNIPIADLSRVHVDVQGNSQGWWLLPPGNSAAVNIGVAGPLRVESRLLDPETAQEPYVLELSLDGERLDWFKLTTRPSRKATHEEWIVGHKKRLKIDIDRPGRLELRVVAPPDVPCLVRFRRAIADGDD